FDARARAAERQERHCDMRVLDREPERGAHLIAVERTVTRSALPACALASPGLGSGILGRGEATGFVAAESVAPGSIILAAYGSEKTLETEALIGKPDRPVRVALAGGDRVTQPRDQQIAHHDLAHHPLRGAVRQQDVDGRERRAAVGDAQLDLLLAR